MVKLALTIVFTNVIDYILLIDNDFTIETLNVYLKPLFANKRIYF